MLPQYSLVHILALLVLQRANCNEDVHSPECAATGCDFEQDVSLWQVDLLQTHVETVELGGGEFASSSAETQQGSQKSSALGHRNRTAGVEYPLSMYYGLSPKHGSEEPNSFYAIRSDPKACSMMLPNITKWMAPMFWLDVEPKPVPSRFMFGKCPVPLKGELRRVGLGLNKHRDDAPAGPGYNPSFVRLPSHLQAAFPAGHWLAIFRVGGEDRSGACPAKVGARRVNVMMALLDPESYYLQHGSHLAILDEQFQTIAQTKVKVRGGDEKWNTASVTDAKIISLKNGEIFIGFNGYALDYSPYKHVDEYYYKTNELVSLLMVNANHGARENDIVLEAWINHAHTRLVQECKDLGMHAPGPKKNLGFFIHPESEELQVMDWIYPTKVGIMQPASLKEESMRKSDYLPISCFGYLPEAGHADLSEAMAGVLDFKLRNAILHNGANLIWIDTLGEFLGVGHIIRGASGRLDEIVSKKQILAEHHYTHTFFTISGSAPFTLKRVGTEFCFESARVAGDCETTQYASSLALEGDKLHVGYGIMDCEAAVMTVNLTQALDTLRPMQPSRESGSSVAS